LLAEVERRLTVPARIAPPPHQAELERLAARSGGRYRPARLAEAHAAATDPANAAIARRGALYPDHVVFLGPSPLPVLSLRQVEPWLAAATARADMPALLLVEGVGMLLRADLGSGAEEMAACLGLVLPRLDPEAPLVFLSAEQESELLDWDAEKYRQSLNTAEQ